MRQVYPQYMQADSTITARKYDLVVWGASGFTGRLVVEYLVRKYPLGGSLRWAVAGRDRAKLELVLAAVVGDGPQPPIIIADSHNEESLQQLTQSTSVILTTVGPYAKYGSELVAACVRNGTHYCDLAGEVQWMRAMIDQHQSGAVASGARIVPSCGFDSIPSDIGVFCLQKHAIEQHGVPCDEITLLVKAMKGGASGGTVASMLTALDQAREDREIAKILVDPYALNPVGERDGPDGPDQANIEFNTDAGVWTGPFIMAAVNTRIVRRSNALCGYPYGREFRYRESTITGSGAVGWCKSALLTAGLGAFMLASSVAFTRKTIVPRLVPKPGEGPTAQQRENGFFNLQLIGKLPGGKLLRLRVKGDRDPGYGSTSKMLAESAVCLAQNDLDVAGGFWTPASAMGTQLLDRLQKNAGLSFELE
jgi:short subunit dehydrogenase-like uncharacterized protein